MGFVSIFWKEQHPRGLLAKNQHFGANCLWDIGPVMLWWLYTNPSKFDLGLNVYSLRKQWRWARRNVCFRRLKRLDPSQIWGYWRWVTSLTKQTVKKELSLSIFFYTRLQKQHNSLVYWSKICMAWVRSQLRWAWNWLKLNDTSSMFRGQLFTDYQHTGQD